MVKCFTKKKNDGSSYTACVDFNKKTKKTTKPKSKPKRLKLNVFNLLPKSKKAKPSTVKGRKPKIKKKKAKASTMKARMKGRKIKLKRRSMINMY
jgi:hypothetical protein